MSNNMEKEVISQTLEELLKNKEKLFEVIKNSPGLKRRNEEMAATLAKLPRPFPWEMEKSNTDA
jgi:hypothetical protein